MRDGKIFWQLFLLFFTSLILAGNARSEQIVKNLAANDFQLVQSENGEYEIMMEGFGNLLTPGEPMLPARTFMIEMPPDARIISVEIIPETEVEIDGFYQIRPAPLTLPMTESHDLTLEARSIYEKNRSIYKKDAFFPDKVGWLAGEGSYRQVKFVRVVFVPFIFNPVRKKLKYIPHIQIIVNYTTSKTPTRSLSNPILPNDSGRILSFNQLRQKYYSGRNAAQNIQSGNYVIIMPAALENAISPLVNWKQMLGYSVSAVTIEWIFEQYSGLDLPERIRNFLIDKYSEWGIEYVLLVGDVDDIPMRMCSPKANSSDENTPTDYYYADLTGNWDADGDGKFGEYGEDNPDWVPEVIVGRIPWSDAATVQQICEKLVRFEGDNGTWKKNGLLMGAMSNYENEDGKGWAKTDGAALMELHKTMLENIGGTVTTMYERAGIDSSSFTSDRGLTHNNIIDEWTSKRFGLANWWAHGSSSGAYRKYWASDDGDEVPESSAGEFSWKAMITTSDCNTLSDTYPTIIFANSCDNGYPERTSLGRTMIRHGSAGIVASSRMSWYTVGWQQQNHGGNASLDYSFFDYLMNHNDKVGEALFDAKVYYANHFMFRSWGWVCWQNLFDFNLYGDPALNWQGADGQPQIYRISGGVYYQNSSVPVAGVQVRLSGGATASLFTDASGKFDFPGLPSGLDYQVVAYRSGQIDETAILGFDAALAARIAMGLYENPTEEELLAADVDENGQVQLYDASLIAQFSVGILPVADSHVADWAFKPASRSYLQLNSDFYEQNFVAVLIGDVDGNWRPQSLMAKVNSSKENYPYLTDMKIESGKTFSVPLRLEGDNTIFSFDAVIHFDNKLFQFIAVNSGIESDKLQLFENDNGQGVLRITGFSPKGLSNGEGTIEIEFQAANQPGRSGLISIETFRINNSAELKAQAEVKIISPQKPLPVAFDLKQNYPNPFNPTTMIAYDLPRACHVKLIVYNALGQKIHTLTDEVKEAGTYRIEWSGRDEAGESVSSGVYFYELLADDFRQVKKMLLVR